jgi:RNA polymerase sigma-70 factor (ECF subfamily)
MRDDRRALADPMLTVLTATRTRERMLLVARRLLRDRQDAEDCVQEALMVAWRSRQGFLGRASALSWLQRVVINACLMHRRHGQRKRRGSGAPKVPLEEVEDALVAGGDGPLDRLLLEERMHEVGIALASLGRIDAHLLLAQALGDEVEELARGTRSTPVAVKSRLFRARQTLRARVEASASCEEVAEGSERAGAPGA